MGMSRAVLASSATLSLDSRVVMLANNRFRVGERVGEGGMGVVFAAWDRCLARTVAIKLSRVGATRSCWASRARLLREAEALALVCDPNVVRLVDVGVDGGMAWLAMERLIAAPLSGRRWTRAEVVHIGRQIGGALAAVHDAGLVHRDVTPRNILVGSSGHAWLIDFGLARVAGPTSGDSFTDLLLSSDDGTSGTRRFMAPEQCRGGPVDAAADQYSLCATLLATAHADQPEGAADAFAGVRRVLERGCEELPARRYPDMRAFVVALSRCGGR